MFAMPADVPIAFNGTLDVDEKVAENLNNRWDKWSKRVVSFTHSQVRCTP
jgi:hypothetical protein